MKLLKRPCQACKRPIALLFKVGNAKIRRPHNCPHGKSCPAGEKLWGEHCNGPRKSRCLECWLIANPEAAEILKQQKDNNETRN